MNLRPRFSLRTLLLLVASCAGVMAWQQIMVRWVKDRHALLELAILYSDGPGAFDSSHWYTRIDTFPSGAPWYWRMWGEDTYVQQLEIETNYADEKTVKLAKSARRLFPEAVVSVYNAHGVGGASGS